MFCKSDNIDIAQYIKAENFYEEILDPNDNPTQGDIIIPYQSLIDKEEYKGVNILGVIIITNQCDIEQKRARFITFTPIYRVSYFLKLTTVEEREKFKNVIKQNHRTLFYLAPHPSLDDKIGGVVYFENIRSENLKTFYIKNPKPKLRLRRPFIDRLCSKIAFFFNRVPINHPSDDKIDYWINENEIIKNIMEMSKLQQNAQYYITNEDVGNWIKENKNFGQCIELLKKYGDAQKFKKTKKKKELEKVIRSLESIENSSEKRFIKLKEDFVKLTRET